MIYDKWHAVYQPTKGPSFLGTHGFESKELALDFIERVKQSNNPKRLIPVGIVHACLEEIVFHSELNTKYGEFREGHRQRERNEKAKY